MWRTRVNIGWVIALALSFAPLVFWLFMEPPLTRFQTLSRTTASVGQITGLVGMAMFSVAMMLRFSFNLTNEADAIEKAVESVLNKGYRTADINQHGMKLVGCKGMGEAIISEI